MNFAINFAYFYVPNRNLVGHEATVYGMKATFRTACTLGKFEFMKEKVS